MDKNVESASTPRVAYTPKQPAIHHTERLFDIQ